MSRNEIVGRKIERLPRGHYGTWTFKVKADVVWTKDVLEVMRKAFRDEGIIAEIVEV